MTNVRFLIAAALLATSSSQAVTFGYDNLSTAAQAGYSEANTNNPIFGDQLNYHGVVVPAAVRLHDRAVLRHCVRGALLDALRVVVPTERRRLDDGAIVRGGATQLKVSRDSSAGQSISRGTPAASSALISDAK